MVTKTDIAAACASMATVVVRMLTATGSKGDPILGPTHISVYETAEHLLECHLSLTGPPVAQSDGRQFRHLLMSVDAFPTYFGKGHLNSQFDAILLTYIELGGYYGDLPTTQFPFQPIALPTYTHPHESKKNSTQSLVDLATIGYLETLAQGYRWTDKAGPMFQQSALWHPDGHSNFDADEVYIENAARKFIANMPEEIEKIVRIDADKAFWPIHRALSGDAWYQMADTRLAERIVEICKEKKF